MLSVAIRYAGVATVLTVYGIETCHNVFHMVRYHELQQCLPFTVLKRRCKRNTKSHALAVATVLTVYGIETSKLQAYHKYQ